MYTPTLEIDDDPLNDMPIWRISVERYHEMIAAEILTQNDKLELLDGFLVEKMTVQPPHAFTTNQLYSLLSRLIPPAFFARSQQPITLSESEPEPDVTIIKGERRDFVARHPSAAETPIVIEVSDSTIRQDRTRKKRIYAQAGIETYWIVNLPRERVEVYTEPVGNDYKQTKIYHANQSVPVILNGEQVGEIKVEEILP